MKPWGGREGIPASVPFRSPLQGSRLSRPPPLHREQHAIMVFGQGLWGPRPQALGPGAPAPMCVLSASYQAKGRPEHMLIRGHPNILIRAIICVVSRRKLGAQTGPMMLMMLALRGCRVLTINPTRCSKYTLCGVFVAVNTSVGRLCTV